MEHGSCLGEEEIPHNGLAEWISKNSSPSMDEEETPLADFDMDTAPPVEAYWKIEQTMPNPHHFSDDHLQIIFDMQRSLEDQTHNQCTLNQCIYLLFDALSDVLEKTRCPTCGQKFFFTYNNDGCPVLPNF